ncbi:MAG: sulfite exporter TauE/SafE family protein [Alphaproteobacteria bacterium]
MLTALFFVTALIYACVGFGGGSTYNALLVLNDTDYRILPFIALGCNIIVVSGGVWHFARAGHIKLNHILPWIVFSVPAAWLGGFITVSESIFIGLLGGALLLSGVKMLWPDKHEPTQTKAAIKPVSSYYVPLLVGLILGFIAGLTGIGGGIFLAPILHFVRWSNSKNIAGACSLFILVNSCAGIIGQMMKINDSGFIFSALSSYWLLLIAVLIGGQIGSWLGALKINMRAVKMLTALLILYVAIRLLHSLF